MADVQPLGNTISDDDELASVLAGVKNEAAALDASQAAATGDTSAVASLPTVPPSVATLDFEETPTAAPAVDVAAPSPISDIKPPIVADPIVIPALEVPTIAPVVAAAPAITTPVAASPELESLKKETLGELRPLVGKLELPAEEKFDTLLLIIRSTDDQSLLGPAHDAAKLITDDARRAGALLDIIKEIDYFSTKA